MITKEHARTLRSKIVKASVSLPDEDALEAVELFPRWVSDITYVVGTRVFYGEKLYKCNQEHTSQSDWTPDMVPALWTEVAKPGEIPVWRQPTGAQDAYQMGDQVHYPGENDPVYESLINNNTWSPEAYPAGWRVVN